MRFQTSSRTASNARIGSPIGIYYSKNGSFAELTKHQNRPQCSMRFIATLATALTFAASHSAIIYDALNPSSGSPTYVVAAQLQRQSFADDFDVSSNIQLAGFQFAFTSTVTNRSFDARIRFWDTVNYSATGTNSALSTQLGSTVTTTINAVSSGFQNSPLINLTSANIFLNAGNRAFTIEVLEVGTNNYVANSEISPLLSDFLPSVGSSLSAHIREGSPGTVNGIWEGQEIRVPSSLRFVAAQIQAVPEPATLSVLLFGLLAIRKLRKN